MKDRLDIEIETSTAAVLLFHEIRGCDEKLVTVQIGGTAVDVTADDLVKLAQRILAWANQ